MKKALRRVVPLLLALILVAGAAQPAFAAEKTAAAAKTTAAVTLKKPVVTGKVQKNLPKLTWKAVSGAKKYVVYRAAAKTGKYTQLATVTGKTYTDKKAVPGKIYYYKVKAMNAAGKTSAFSAVVKVTVPLAKPTVKVTVLKSGAPKVTWEAVKGASQYVVYRAASKSGKYTALTTTAKKAYTDKSAEAGKTYYYKVKAVSAAKVAATGTAVSAKTPEKTVTYTKVRAKLSGQAVAVFCVPSDWDYELDVFRMDEGLPRTAAALQYGDVDMTAIRLGADAYEAAGVSMPESLEEYSQRAGVREALEEGEEFTEDERGNLLVKRTYDRDGVEYAWYFCLKQGTDAYGIMVLELPASMDLDVAYLLANSSLA